MPATAATTTPCNPHAKGPGSPLWRFGGFLFALLVLFGRTCLAADPPNVIVILADDLGYADIGVHGGDIETPHIDSIAATGVRFTSAYVTYASCSASRAGLLTGRHPMRFGFVNNPDRVVPTRPGNPLGLPPGELTLAELLADAGYETAAIGKWHLGKAVELHPLSQGFGEFYGFLGSLQRYFVRGRERILRDREPVAEDEYLTRAFTREALRFIERPREGPFFLYLAYNAVHTPLMGEKLPGAGAQVSLKGTGDVALNRQIYRDMVKVLDQGVGAILARLQELGMSDNTLLAFLSDNGGSRTTGAYDNTPLRDFKGSNYEGGIRVPLLLRWPARLAAGMRYDLPVSSMDLFATAAVAADATLPRDRVLDGVDLMPYLAGERSEEPHDALFWHWRGAYAVRSGPWKLLQYVGLPPELYRLDDDVAESNNLAAQRGERVAALQKSLRLWRAELAEPLWQRPPSAE